MGHHDCLETGRCIKTVIRRHLGNSFVFLGDDCTGGTHFALHDASHGLIISSHPGLLCEAASSSAEYKSQVIVRFVGLSCGPIEPAGTDDPSDSIGRDTEEKSVSESPLVIYHADRSKEVSFRDDLSTAGASSAIKASHIAKSQAFMNVAQIKSGQDITELPEPSIHVAAVIPAYRVEDHLAEVIAQVPHLVRTIIAVDDRSPDGTGQLLDQLTRKDRRLIVIHHEINRGVGGATKSGYLEALRRGADVVVKLDGDGQMDPEYIERLVEPIVAGQAQYAKGNRFQDWSYLQTMPLSAQNWQFGSFVPHQIGVGLLERV